MASLRMVCGAVAALGLLALAACGGPAANNEPLPEVTTAATTAPPSVTPSEAAPSPAPKAAATVASLDLGALVDHTNPERLLRFYAEALRAGEWGAAARAWSTDADVSAARLQNAYSGEVSPNIAVGKGDMEGAAGTLFYSAPIVISFPNGKTPEKRGSIVLRRANDVPGASEEQLEWRIERSDILPPANLPTALE